MNERVRIRSRRIAFLFALAGLVATVASSSAPSSASAACPETPGVFTTSWGGGSGHYNTDANWTNGVPTASCDASITAAGTYTVVMTGGSTAKSMTIGGAGSNPTLQISAENSNTNLNVAAGGQLSIASGAAITLKCNVTPSSCGAPNIGAPSIANAGTITVAADVNADANSTSFISGPLLNTGTMQFNHRAKFDNGAVTNQGTVNIADGTLLLSGGSSCGDTSVAFKNDAGGTLNATGTGTFDVLNYEQGNGPMTGANPVQVPCGSLKYTGNGASKIKVYGGINLTGTIQSNQSLTISDESSNTNAFLGGPVTNNGTITLTCSVPCGAGGGPDIAAQGNTFTNAGTLTVTADAGTGSVIDSGNGGTVVNTGTINFNQSGALAGVINNQGAINIADTKVVRNEGSSCGDAGAKFANNTGGSINGTGSGALSVINYEQGAGVTTGTAPIQVPCGTVKYLGAGASKVQANGGFTLTGEMQSNQSLTVSAASANTNVTLGGNFTNKGAITLTCPGGGCSGGSGGGSGFNVNDKDFVNTGTFTVAAASGTGASVGANTEGSIVNTGTMSFEQTAALGGPVTNQGPINIADGKAVSSGGSCGGGPVKNDTGGSINATGTGALFVGNYEQGNGTTTGANPVQLYGGCLKYSSAPGVGASKVLAYAGFDLSGEMQPGQELTVTNNSPNTNLRLVSPFTSKGSITLTCPSSPCGGPGFNGNGNLFTNMGTFTVDAAASSGSTNLDRSSGGITNAPAGTFQFNADTQFNGSGPFLNQGTLRIAAGVNNTPSFTNSGTIELDQGSSNPFLNTSTLTNTGTIKTSGGSANTSSINGTVDQTGASAQVIVAGGTKLSLNNPLLLKAGKLSGGGTLQGSVDNSGGTVLPGASPGTLTVSGNYTQGAGGELEIEIGGTGAGQFDQLAIGGSATLAGALDLRPTPAYVTAATPGDSVAFLTYGGTRTGTFASTTATPPPKCQDTFGTVYDDGAKKVSFAVSASGAVCSKSDPQSPPPPPGAPDTVLGTHPKPKVKTKKSKAQVKFTFSASASGATFECKLDKAAYARCTSPKSYKVKPGKHSFSVRAVGAGGADSTPASFSFKVVKQKPKPKK
jgi:fibronectin-binding autotransporter adhesin